MTHIKSVVLLIAAMFALPGPAHAQGNPGSLREAAERGDANAQFGLGRRLLADASNSDREDAKATKEAAEWLEKSASQGHREAQFVLGSLYTSWRQHEDNRLAIKWLTKSVEQGYPRALFALGQCDNEGGHGIVQDPKLAQAWFDKAAQSGDIETLDELERVYRLSTGCIPKDFKRAAELCEKMAVLGRVGAQFDIAQRYEFGFGVKQDLAKAQAWYLLAADKKHGDAAAHLGRMYELGLGVPKNLEIAKEWYEKAAALGEWLGEEGLRRLDPANAPKRSDPYEPQIMQDLQVSLHTDKAEFAVDEPMLIVLKCRNLGSETYVHPFGTRPVPFRRVFEVRDEHGRLLANPFTTHYGRGTLGGCLRAKPPSFRPGEELTRRELLNQCVHISEPGTYTVTAQVTCWLDQADRDKALQRRRAPDAALKIVVRPVDPKKRAAAIQSLIDALQQGANNPIDYAADDYSGNSKILRRLVFFHDAKLIPLFLDHLERTRPYHHDEIAFQGLASLADRQAVLRAIEARLDHPEKHNSLALSEAYIWLALPDNYDSYRFYESLWREMELRDRLRTKQVEFLKQDKTFRHAELAGELLGGADDRVLVKYILQSNPDKALLTKSRFALERVALAADLLPLLERALDNTNHSDTAAAILFQLVRLDRDKYLKLYEANRWRVSPHQRSYFAPLMP